MKFTRELASALTVRRVASEELQIGDTVYKGSVAVSPDAVFPDWPRKSVAELSADDFADLLDDDPELLILGTGSSSQFPPRELMFAFARRGIGLEVMDTKAAARTFNVLTGEGRKVVAVLYVD